MVLFFFCKNHFQKIFPGSISYAIHIATEHSILQKYKKSFGSTSASKHETEEDEAEDTLMPFTFEKKEEKIVYVKRKPPFKCPMENSCRTSKDEKRFREHLSQHFASNIKKDFPFFQENGKYICPIVDCEFLGML